MLPCADKRKRKIFCKLKWKDFWRFRNAIFGQKSLQRWKRIIWKVFWWIQKKVVLGIQILLQKRFLQKRYLASQINSPEKVLIFGISKFIWSAEGSEVSNWSVEAEKFSGSFLNKFSARVPSLASYLKIQEEYYNCSYHISGRSKKYSQNRKDTRRICCLHQKVLYED